MQAPDVSARVESALAHIRSELPPGYRIDAGGAIEEIAKANKALFALFPLMILLDEYVPITLRAMSGTLFFLF